MEQEEGTSIELARVRVSGQQAESRFCEYGLRPIGELKSYLGSIELDGSQYVRWSLKQGSAGELHADLIKFYCQLANLSEVFYKPSNEGQWLRTVIKLRKTSSLDDFSSNTEVIKELLSNLEFRHFSIHSNVLPREALCPSSRHHCQDPSHRGFFSTRVIREESPHLMLEEHLCSCNNCWRSGVDLSNFTERSEADPIELLVLEQNDLQFVREIDGGAQADIYEVLWRGGRFVQKFFRCKPSYTTEVRAAKHVSHPNIIHYFGSSELGGNFLCMELMDGTLFQFIADRFRTEDLKRFLERSPEKAMLEVAEILLQVALAMELIHKKGFVHGDLKLDNILYSLLKWTCSRSKCLVVKVADFGKVQDSDIERYRCQGVDRFYAAPEVKEWVHSRKYRDESSQEEKRRKTSTEQSPFKYPKKIDVFSFGTIGYQVLSGEKLTPRTSRDLTPEDFNSLKKKLEGRKEGLSLVSLVEKCRAPEPEDRPEFTGICEELRQILQNCDDRV